MKKSLKLSLLVTCTLCLLGFTSFGQTDDMEKTTMIKMADKPLKERISISPSIGWLHSWGDFKTDGFMPSFLQSDENKLGYGINLNYQLTNVFSISGGVLFGKLEGQLENVNTVNARNSDVDYGFGIIYQTDLFELTLPRINANITRAIFKNRSKFFNKASIGLFASHGLVYYESEILPASGEDVNLFFTRDRGRSGKTTEAVTSLGGFFTYQVSNQFDVSLESSIRSVYNDKLDAWVAGDFDDKYSYTAVALTYHFGKRKSKPKAPEKKLMAKEEMKKTSEEMMKEVEEKEEVVKEEVTQVEEKMEEKVEEKVEETKTEEKVEEKVEETKVEVKKEAQKKEVRTSNITGYRYYVVVAAFKGQTSTDLLMTRLKKKGENPFVIRNLEDTWNLVTIAEYDTKATALKEMKKARKRGFDKSWVHILPPVEK